VPVLTSGTQLEVLVHQAPLFRERSPLPATKVAIAVVESAGQILVGVRPEGTPLAGKSEFPGGKCHTDETPRSCVVRECREETGLVVIPREHLATVTHEYEHDTVELHFWRCALAPDLPDRADPQHGFRWVRPTELAQLDFPEANREIVAMLTKPTS
jgi:8-oxo-dGTP diphosphatase